MRRVWIEILVGTLLSVGCAMSPSMRRVWIEILVWYAHAVCYLSPSMRRVWIEICFDPAIRALLEVTLHAEGVD